MKLLEKMSIKSAVKFISVTVGVCSVVVLTTVIATNISFPERGQGGHETPGIPVVTEEELMNDKASIDPDFVTSETPVEAVIGNHKNFAESVSAAVATSESNKNLTTVPKSEYNLSYISYRVKSGDMIGKIAQEYNISSDSILSLNHINNARGLQIGQYLKIPTMSGILYTTKRANETVASITDKYDVDSTKFAAVNHVALNASFDVGSTVFVPDAKMDWATVQEINGDLFKKPIRAKWYQSSSFGWRSSPFTSKRSYHSGIDMACPTGTSVYSALSGVVTSTGYSSTYGNYAIITHHSGYKTLYGHMSAILCVKGQMVDQNTRIGRVGSTGLSTGPHLHFTVYKNGAAVNPAILWN